MEDFEVYETTNDSKDTAQIPTGEKQNKEKQVFEEQVFQKNTTQEQMNGDDSGTGKKPRRKKKAKDGKNFFQQHSKACLVSGCLLLSVGGGFGGTMAALNLMDGGSKTVLYQSVNNSTSKTSTTSTSADALSVKEVANKTMESVVEIKTESVSTNDYFQQAVQSGAGSGVILSKDGYIVTNNHVIDGANKITVTTKDGKSYEAKLIGTDSSTDLAVIKVEASDLTPAVLGTSSKLEVGDTAIAIGNPLGELGGTVTSGIISALDREITVDNQTMHLLQTNAAINPGNSGGGLFNDQGELIGIVNAKSSGSNIEGLGFAIPIDRAKDVITNLIENGYVKGRASLGVTLTAGTSNNPFAQSSSAQVYIAEVVNGKAAAKAGLQAGDQILKVDGEEVTSISDVKTAVNSHKAGETMKITVLRNNETKEITVTLGEADTTTTSNSDSSSNQNNR